MVRRYDASKETVETVELIEENCKGDKICIATVQKEDGNIAKVDVRRMYTKDGELKHSTQGLRFSTDMTVGIIEALIKTLDRDKRQDLLLEINKL